MQTIINHVSHQQSRGRILVIGDLILDEYIFGSVNRISPEAPVQIVEQHSENFTLGGAANVAHNLATIACSVDMMGVIGDDTQGRKLTALMKEKGIETSSLYIDESRPTTSKLRIIAGNQQIVRVDNEVKTPISSEAQASLLEEVKEKLAHADALILSDYQKGVLSPELCQNIIAEAKKANVLLIADPKGKDLSKLKGVDIITPNKKELQHATPDNLDEEASIDYLFEKLQLKNILLTRGEEGMRLYTKGKPAFNIQTTAKEVYDVTGAGDTVVSVLTMALTTGLNLKESCKLANCAAGIVVGKLGTSTITIEELLGAIKEYEGGEKGKIVPASLIGSVSLFLRNHQKRIVFTNGCFDIIHYGHISYLQEASSRGDILIVGLNSDASVRRLKGSSRPVVGEKERASVLAALNCIDYVVIFDQDTPQELIASIKPDVLVKGGDYTPDQVVGREVVEKTGGRVEIIPLVEGLSTSNIVQRIVENHHNDENCEK